MGIGQPSVPAAGDGIGNAVRTQQGDLCVVQPGYAGCIQAGHALSMGTGVTCNDHHVLPWTRVIRSRSAGKCQRAGYSLSGLHPSAGIFDDIRCDEVQSTAFIIASPPAPVFHGFKHCLDIGRCIVTRAGYGRFSCER